MSLKGIIPACVTPWKRDDVVDEAALWRELELLIGAGVHGLCVAGSTGEFTRLSRAEFARLVRATVEIAGGRVPVIAGIGHASMEGSLQLAQMAQEAGADFVLPPPPFYFPYGQAEIQSFYQCLAGQLSLPILLYNIPQYTSAIEPATAVALLAQGVFAGIKESGGSPEMMRALLVKPRSYAVLWGYDANFDQALERGADGAISGLAACAPEPLLKLYESAQRGDHRGVDCQQARIRALCARLGDFPAPVAIRLALQARGIPVGPHAVPLGEDRVSNFVRWFERWRSEAS